MEPQQTPIIEEGELISETIQTTPPKEEEKELFVSPFKSEAEYLVARARLQKGYQVLKDKWAEGDRTVKRHVRTWEQLGIDVLLWEIEHDLLPI